MSCPTSCTTRRRLLLVAPRITATGRPTMLSAMPLPRALKLRPCTHRAAFDERKICTVSSDTHVLSSPESMTKAAQVRMPCRPDSRCWPCESHQHNARNPSERIYVGIVIHAKYCSEHHTYLPGTCFGLPVPA